MRSASDPAIPRLPFTLLGLNWHGINKSNFRLLYDVESEKFFPAISRDDVPTKLKEGFDPPEEQLNFCCPAAADREGFSFRMANMLARNDKIRKATYRKVSNFINSDQDKIQEEYSQLTEEQYKGIILDGLNFLRISWDCMIMILLGIT